MKSKLLRNLSGQLCMRCACVCVMYVDSGQFTATKLLAYVLFQNSFVLSWNLEYTGKEGLTKWHTYTMSHAD